MAQQLSAPESAALEPDLPEGMDETERYRAERDHCRQMFDQRTTAN